MTRTLRTNTNESTVMSAASGMDINKVNTLLQMKALSDPKNASKYATIMNMFKVNKPSATELAKQETKKHAQNAIKQMDKTLNLWENIPITARLNPFGKYNSPQKASYLAAKNLANYTLITMVADKRITDAERKIFMQNFPTMYDTKKVAQNKINTSKQMMAAYSDIEPIETSTNSGGVDILDDVGSYYNEE